MSLGASFLGLIFCIALSIFCSSLDKKSGQPNFRVVIAVAGIMSMMCLFFFLLNLLVYFKVL